MIYIKTVFFFACMFSVMTSLIVNSTFETINLPLIIFGVVLPFCMAFAYLTVEYYRSMCE